MDSLPKLDLPGNLKNPMLTRIDIGSGLEGVPMGYFVNEVEFVPSLFIEEIDPEKFPIIKTIGSTLVDVAGIYQDAKLPINTIF